MKKCPNCGKMNLDKAAVCKECQCEIDHIVSGAFEIKRPEKAKNDKDEVQYTVIKETDYYKERLEPAWEYPDPDDQWLFAETVKEYVGTKYDILYVFADNTYKEMRGQSSVPEYALAMARTNIGYHEAKCRLKKRWWWQK